ncbi:precorrin-3B C(17)-methyltransferase [Senegalia massiliensis]|uniref:Precorrin-3B C(17)-methyltransferase n=1 Tax=Senegalia massiliensis TaxID=1720316 RepID=A0A845R1L8_9CLOT|nr:precorrin-3B C(17)-methyltransferase [Senegalia massiliensis]NBI06473.1 precorrin-3B C(17)-methyltransferase [Senegalia massiliensis]
MSNGKIYVVGIGPGDKKHMTFRAVEAIKESDIIIGYKKYIELVNDLIDDKKIVSSQMKKEVERCEKTLEYAEDGKTVALVSSGDAGVYGMAGIMLEIVLKHKSDVEVEIVPGVSASNASAACVGAPLMHDFVTISLSDLLTDWSLIEKRLRLAAEGDFSVAIYNPKSKKRTEQIVIARDIFLKHKDKSTPVAIVRNAKREGEETILTDLENMLNFDIDMFTTVIIGNSNSYIDGGKMVTPRGYKI